MPATVAADFGKLGPGREPAGPRPKLQKRIPLEECKTVGRGEARVEDEIPADSVAVEAGVEK